MKNTRLCLALCLLLPVTCYARSWSFSSPVDVSTAATGKIYQHLESAGRRNIAVSSGSVAVVWEDDRSGTPAVYLALKKIHDTGFQVELKLSGKGEAYEPGLVALTDNRFAISWEENNKVYVRIVDATQLKHPESSEATELPPEQAMQAGLTASDDLVFVTFSARDRRYTRIGLIQLKVDKQKNLRVMQSCLVDPSPVKGDQLYPAAVIVDKRIVIAWEDRRMGHTIIMASQSKPGDMCRFSPPQRISEASGAGNRPYGKGHGVSRVALGRFGKSGVLAAWADKRNFREGYDIYAAMYDSHEGWGPNSRVQDEFGGVAAQWHATVAGDAKGHPAVAWTDEREGQSDVFLSGYGRGEWSEDIPVPGASGTGQQTQPSIVLDDDGNMHIAWILRKEAGGVTRLQYMFGQLTDADTDRNGGTESP